MPDVRTDFIVYGPLETEPISRRTYDATIADYWNFLLSPKPDNPVFGAPPALFTCGVYNYRDVQTLEDIRRKNFAGQVGETPSIIHFVGTPDAPFNPGANMPVFITVLDTIALDANADEIDENGNQVSPEDVLKDENDAVKPGQVRLTIQRQNGGQNPLERIDVINYRHKSNLFNLNVRSDSVLAHRMERPFDRGTAYPHAIAEGYYVLIRFTNAGLYRLNAQGSGARDYNSQADYHIQLPAAP
jgi:hypothetical protein